MAKRFKFLQRIPGLGKLAKAASFVDKATAKPVRVVNFDEMGRMPGAIPGQLPLFGGAPGKGGGMLGKIGGFVKKLGPGALVLGKFVGAAAAAGAAGVAIGTAFDRLTGASDKIASQMWNIYGANKRLESIQRVEEHTKKIAVENANRMAATFANLARRGVKAVAVEGGGRKALTGATAADLIRKRLAKQGKTDKQIADILKTLQKTLSKLPTAQDLKVSVQVNEREIAKASAKANEEAGARRGERGAPGDRRRARSQ
jgi:DNA-binding CsgD family transcriptional regulator